jgi:hypothetical protein
MEAASNLARMPEPESHGTDSWLEVRATVLAQHRTLRMLAEAARGIAAATLRGDALGIAAMPYVVLALDRAIQTQFSDEELLVCPLLERELGAGRGAADSLRTRHRHILREVGVLATGGVQDVVIVARRLHALTGTLLADMTEQEQTLWPADRAGWGRSAPS